MTDSINKETTNDNAAMNNKDSVFLSLDIEETTGGQYADNRNQRNMDSTLCKIIIG